MGQRLDILEMIERGEISAGEGARRLEALAGADQPPEPANSPTQAARVARVPQIAHVIAHSVLWSGVALLCGGGLLVAAVYAWHIANAWQIAGWVLFALGLPTILVGWWMQRARWFSLRVREDGKRTIALALPLPLGLLAWGVRVARPWVPQFRETGFDELVLSIQEELHSGQPLVVDVAEATHAGSVHITLE